MPESALWDVGHWDRCYWDSIYMDPILNVMLKLKDNWSLTGDLTGSSVKFSTGWYDGAIQLPQVTVTPGTARQRALSTGTPVYAVSEGIMVNLWVRPKQDSNTSIGWAKNAIYDIRQEVERILLAHANIGVGFTTPYISKEYVFLSGWRDLTERNRETGRPIIFRQQCVITDAYHKSDENM